jgi:hypothetical protein
MQKSQYRSGHRKATRSARPLQNRNIFEEVNLAAKPQIKELAQRWLGQTRMSGDNLQALNPTRADKNIGSFSINIRTGVWSDFATQDSGGDIISFYAYLHRVRQIEAAREIASLLGVET